MPSKHQPSERWLRLKAAFWAATDLDAKARAEFLAGVDPDIVEELESLLRHPADASLLEPSTPAERAGVAPHYESIGPYRVLDVVAEGGMGIVYAALQEEPVRRRVALKLIKAGMDTREVVARFESERQALALMSHPGIAAVYDAGEAPDGRPYFAMEYVPGEPITRYCETHHLGLVERLELFALVCDAVQHAHMKGIIHRDLKPSNILVTIDGNDVRPKVIDFGIAKATSHALTDRTLRTELGQLVGTPEYMSPEQADATSVDIDTRTDVYSLGVVLYELLTGARPFDSARFREKNIDEIRRMIRDEEPPMPSARVRQSTESPNDSLRTQTARGRALRGDLDWITMKALEKDPAQRYQAAQELKSDVLHHLRNEPVQVGPPSFSYMLAKFVRRNRAAVAASGVVTIAIVVGLALASIGFVRASRERDAAELARRDSEAVTQFLSDMLSAADPDNRGREVTVREVLDAAAASLTEDFATRPVIEARLQGTIGDTYVGLGLYTEAERHLRRQLQLRNAQGEDAPERLRAMEQLAQLYRLQGRHDEALEAVSSTLRARERLLGDAHADTLASLNALGLLQYERGRYEEAAAALDKALRLRKRVLGEEDASTLASMNNLALVYQELGRLEEAQTLHEQELTICRRVLGAEHPDTLISMNNLAGVLRNRKKYEEAEALYLKTIEIQHRVLGEKHPETLRTMSNLAVVYMRAGRFADAEVTLRRAWTDKRETLGERSRETLISLIGLAHALCRQDEFDESEKLWQRFEEATDELGADDPLVWIARSNHGECLTRMARYEDAEALLLEAEPHVRELGGVLYLQSTLSNLAKLYEAWERPDAARTYREQVEALSR